MQGIALAWPIAAAVVLVLIVVFAVARPALASAPSPACDPGPQAVPFAAGTIGSPFFPSCRLARQTPRPALARVRLAKRASPSAAM